MSEGFDGELWAIAGGMPKVEKEYRITRADYLVHATECPNCRFIVLNGMGDFGCKDGQDYFETFRKAFWGARGKH